VTPLRLEAELLTNTRNYPSFDRCLLHFSVPPPSSSLKSDEGSELYLRKREFLLFLPDVDDRGDKPGEQAHQGPVSAWPEPHPTTTRHCRHTALHRPTYSGDLRHPACRFRTSHQVGARSRPLTKIPMVKKTGSGHCPEQLIAQHRSVINQARDLTRNLAS